MRTHLVRLLVPLGLATATLVAPLSSASAQPAPHDHRDDRVDSRQGPREAPPPPRTDRRGSQRRGYVYVSGSWDWRNGRWQWSRGRWERVRAGKRWRQPRWEIQGDTYVRVDGTWDDAPQYPEGPPPDPRTERARQRRGQEWVEGHWDWVNGDWEWNPGHFERARSGYEYDEPRWEQREGRWQRVEGGWHEHDDDDIDETRPASTWRFQEAGWTMIGEKTVDGRVDSDQVDFSQKMGKVSKLTVVVVDADLEMIDLKVVFVSGKDFRPSGTQFFREGTRTRVIDLPSSDILRAVQFKYRNLPGGRRARVQVWGNVVK